MEYSWKYQVWKKYVWLSAPISKFVSIEFWKIWRTIIRVDNYYIYLQCLKCESDIFAGGEVYVVEDEIHRIMLKHMAQQLQQNSFMSQNIVVISNNVREF